MHDHSHDHEHCGCGHDHHHHHHGEACGCGHHHHEIKPIEGMTIRQQNMLLALYERRYLPVASFAVGKAGDDSRYAVMLEPVYLGTPEDTMEDVRALGEELNALEEAGLLTLDYDIPLRDYPYTEYHTATLYAYFRETVAEAAGRPGATGDTPLLLLGSMAITEAGEEAVRGMMEAP